MWLSGLAISRSWANLPAQSLPTPAHAYGRCVEHRMFMRCSTPKKYFPTVFPGARPRPGRARGQSGGRLDPCGRLGCRGDAHGPGGANATGDGERKGTQRAWGDGTAGEREGKGGRGQGGAGAAGRGAPGRRPRANGASRAASTSDPGAGPVALASTVKNGGRDGSAHGSPPPSATVRGPDIAPPPTRRSAQPRSLAVRLDIGHPDPRAARTAGVNCTKRGKRPGGSALDMALVTKRDAAQAPRIWMDNPANRAWIGVMRCTLQNCPSQ